MKNKLTNGDLNFLNFDFNKSIAQIKRNNNEINWNKEDVLLQRLQHKLGKSKEEVSKMISKNLLSILTMVPLSSENE